jgi:hypothetical protein
VEVMHVPKGGGVVVGRRCGLRGVDGFLLCGFGEGLANAAWLLRGACWDPCRLVFEPLLKGALGLVCSLLEP